jgi:hypothetical protein
MRQIAIFIEWLCQGMALPGRLFDGKEFENTETPLNDEIS